MHVTDVIRLGLLERKKEMEESDWIVDKHGGHFEVLSRTELGTRIRIVL